jgi:hypothetical protein
MNIFLEKMLKKMIFTLFLVLSGPLLFASENEKLEKLFQLNEVYTYQASRFGLRDLVVQIKIEDLTKLLNDKMIFGKLDNVYFKLYWQFPQKIDVEVIGLPNGYKEVKSQLKQLVYNKLELIFPSPLRQFVKNYKMKWFKNSGEKNGQKVYFIDPSGLLAIREMTMTLSDQGLLSELVTVHPLLTNHATFKYMVRPCSQNKYLLESYVVKGVVSTGSEEVQTNINYGSIENLCLPSEVKSVTKQVLSVDREKKLDEQKRELIMIFRFEKYEINTGAATAYLKNK